MNNLRKVTKSCYNSETYLITSLKTQEIMRKIHNQCVEYGRESNDYVDYLKGANIAGFKKVADAMLAYGVV